jgi:predicted PurR-regulated permease PerM
MKKVALFSTTLMAFINTILAQPSLQSVSGQLQNAGNQVKNWIMIIIGIILAVGILYTVGMMVTGNPKGKEMIGWWLGGLVFYAIAWALI